MLNLPHSTWLERRGTVTGTPEDVTIWRQYFEDLQAEVEAGIAAGLSLEGMQESITMEEYRDVGWDRYDWVDENVKGMYHFLTD